MIKHDKRADNSHRNRSLSPRRTYDVIVYYTLE